MPTLKEIYESHENGQKKQFVEQVNEYGAANFARGLSEEISKIDGQTIFPEDVADMLITYTILNSK